MSVLQSPPWEVRLLLVAQEALESQRLLTTIQADHGVLASAYRQCTQITYDNSRTFYLASQLLPSPKREAVRALYAFCRITDNIVDDPHRSLEDRQIAIDKWRHQIMATHPSDHSPVGLAWADVQVRFGIPRGYAQQLIDGCARDIQQSRYHTFSELAEYAYGVASTVGLMAMHIIGFDSTDALPYAVRLGVALQITNILRDVGEDVRNGRIYLPQDELEAFGISEEDIAKGIVTPEWRQFMAFQIERNRQLYADSMAGIRMLDQDGRFAIGAAAELYRAILSDIEAHDYDVFNRRARISGLGKIARLPGIWWRSR